MKTFLATVRSNIIVQAVLCIALGLFLIVAPDTATLTVVYLIGAYLAITGAASLIAYFRTGSDRYHSKAVLATSIAWLAAAVVVFLFPQGVGGLLSLILGIFLLVSGVVNGVRSYELREFPNSGWVLMLVVSVIVALGGVLIVFNPFGATLTFVMVLGVLLIVKGVSDLAIELLANNGLKAVGQH